MAGPHEIDAKGWKLICASTLGVAVGVIPVCILSLGVFMKPLASEFGWTRGQIALALTILSFSMALTLPVVGRIIDRNGARWPLLCSLVLYGVGLALLPTMIDHGGLAAFYATAAWLGVTGAASSSVAYVKVLSSWFDKSRGLALGCAMSGVAIGGAITPMIASALIQAFDWRAGFQGLALLPIVVGIPFALYLHEAPAAAAARTPSADLAIGISAAQALRTRLFWLLFAVVLLASTAINGLEIHLAPLLSDRGLSPGTAALGLSYMFAVSIVVRLGAGYCFDRVFAPWVGAVCYLCATIGVLLLVTSSPATYLLAVAMIGVGAGAESDLVAILVSRYFGLRAFGAIYGWLFGAFMIGGALGPLLFGLLFDVAGNYGSALSWCVVGLSLTTLILAALPRFPAWAGSPEVTVFPGPKVAAVKGL